MPVLKIDLDKRPALLAALKDPDKKAKAMLVLETMLQLADEALQSREVPWYDLPEKLNDRLSFDMMAKGVMRGVFNVVDMSPEDFEVLGTEVHPFSLFGARKNNITGGQRYTNWRKHFDLPDNAEINADTISDTLHKLLYYARYVDVAKWGEAVVNKQVATYKDLGNAKTLPFYPALQYQLKHAGSSPELSVGSFYSQVGAFRCGPIEPETEVCPACSHGELKEVGEYKVCMACNAGYSIAQEAN
jgi:hypothetical protein